MPHDGMKAGGLPAIVGTLALTNQDSHRHGADWYGRCDLFVSTPKITPPRAIRIAIINLAGIPSVVCGFFGLGAFVIFLNFGTSIVAGSLTLGIAALP